MKIIYYSVTIALSLFIIVSCSTESTPIYQLTTSVEPTEAGTVSPASGEYEEGEQVNVTATANEHWVFDSWQGGQTGSTNPATVTMDSDKNITALFIKRDYPLTVNTEGEGTVNEKVIQAKTTDYPHGTTVELTANPADGWLFKNWEGDLEGGNNPKQVVIENQKGVTAVFKKPNPDFSGGLGTETSPYQVSNLKELQKINNYTDSYFIQINNIDATETLNWNNGEGFKPIGDQTISFTGAYDGDTYTISNLIIDRNDENTIGLFGRVENGTLSNINLQNVDIRGEKYVGSLFGSASNSKIENSQSSGSVRGTETIGGIGGIIGDGEIINVTSNIIINGNFYYVGGIMGRAIDSSFEQVESTGEVTGGNFIGGIIGWSQNSTISGSESSVKIYGGAVGGLVGYNDGEIENSISSSEVTGTNIGGLVGRNKGSIIGSKNYGKVSNTVSIHETAGGLVGTNLSGGSIKKSSASANIKGNNKLGGLVGVNHGSIIQSYFISNIDGNNELGGIAGVNNGEIINSYSISNITGNEDIGGVVGTNRNDGNIEFSFSVSELSGNNNIGGLIGSNGATVKTSFWNNEITEEDGVGRGSTDGTIGLTSPEMQGSSAQENMEFNWEEIWITTTEYPILRWQEE